VGHGAKQVEKDLSLMARWTAMPWLSRTGLAVRLAVITGEGVKLVCLLGAMPTLCHFNFS
jgi:hypothetical protein